CDHPPTTAVSPLPLHDALPILALAHDFTGDIDYRNAAIDAMDYILGRNLLGQSYISGYGKRAMQNPHHRFWAPSADDGLPGPPRSEEHTSELQSRENLVCRLLL